MEGGVVERGYPGSEGSGLGPPGLPSPLTRLPGGAGSCSPLGIQRRKWLGLLTYQTLWSPGAFIAPEASLGCFSGPWGRTEADE